MNVVESPRVAWGSFAGHLLYLRAQADVTQQQLADAVGVHFTYISKLERGKVAPPSEATIRKLASALRTDADTLLGMAGKISPNLWRLAASEPELAVLLYALARKRLTSSQYRRMQDIVDGEHGTGEETDDANG